MLVKILIISQNRVVKTHEVSSEGLKILAQSGVQYRLVDADSGLAPGKMYLKRHEDDLELRFDAEESGEPDIVIEDHFQHMASPLVGEGADGALYSYTSEGGEVAESGKEYIFPEFGQAAHEAAWLDSMAFFPSVDTASTFASAIEGFGQGWLDSPVFAGVAVAGAAAAGAAAVGGYDSNSDPHTISGQVTGGPVLAGNGLTVTAYDKDGKELGQAKVDESGQFEIKMIGRYSGPVLVKVTDDETLDVLLPTKPVAAPGDRFAGMGVRI